MFIKKRNVTLLVVVILAVFLIVFYIASTATLQIKTLEQQIECFTINSTEIAKDNYQKAIKKIENMRFYYVLGIPQSREMDLYVVITDKNGKIEVVGCNDNMVTHMYDGEIVERYRIPFITQIYIKTMLAQGD